MNLDELLARLPAPKLSTDRRRRLAAEVLASSDLQDDLSQSPRRGLAVVVVLAVAATIMVFAWPRRPQRIETPMVQLQPSTEPTRMSIQSIEALATPRGSAMPAVDTDAPIGDEPAVTPADLPRVKRIDSSRTTFAGSGDAHRIDIEQSTLLEGSPAHFRAGWEALRAARYDDAISAFDRATDPAVAEDAAFWAAVAARRAKRADARERFDAFVTRFPQSPRADSARRALESLR